MTDAVDFPAVSGLHIEGFRIAPVTQIEPGEVSGDAMLVEPDGTEIDLHWRAESDEAQCGLHHTIEGGRGVWRAAITEQIRAEGDLGLVLDAVVRALRGTAALPDTS